MLVSHLVPQVPPTEAPTVPSLSVVIPVFNEAETIPALHPRLVAALEAMGRPFEILYVDDGSTDASLALLTSLAAADPRVQVIELARNVGQHLAIVAGLGLTKGEIVVTLDADLQNPPEEIVRLVVALEAGHDVAGGVRHNRQDSLSRTLASRLLNRIVRSSTGSGMRDYGCMLRAYRREVVEQIVRYGETATFIPALANLFAHSPVEVPVDHAGRAAGRSKYGARRLLTLAFDLMTGYSLFPIKLVTVLGGLISAFGTAFGVFLLIRRLIIGPEAEGLFTLFAILFVFLGLQVLALGLVGEYIGRIYFEVRRRPRFAIRRVHRRGW